MCLFALFTFSIPSCVEKIGRAAGMSAVADAVGERHAVTPSADTVGERHAETAETAVTAVTPSALAEAVKLATGLVLGVCICCFVFGFAFGSEAPTSFRV